MGEQISFAARNEPIHVIASFRGIEQQLKADPWDLRIPVSSGVKSINLDTIEYGMYVSAY